MYILQRHFALLVAILRTCHTDAQYVLSYHQDMHYYFLKVNIDALSCTWAFIFFLHDVYELNGASELAWFLVGCSVVVCVCNCLVD